MAKLGKLVENAQKKQQNRANELASYIGTPENQAAAAEIQKKWDTELTKPPVTTPAQSRVNAVEDIWDRGSTTGGSKATATSNLANQIIALENQRKAMEAERSSLYSALSDPTTFDPSKLSQLGNYDTEIQSVKDQMKELSKIRPEYKTEEAEARYKTYANAEERIKSKYGSVEALVKDLETRAADLDRQTEKLKQLEAQYKENPSEKLYTEYTKAYEGYTKAAKTYQGLYLDYQPLQQAWQDYEAYDIAAQGKAGAGETAKRIAQAGITQVGSALWQTAALGEKALGAVFPGVSTPITDEANRVKADADRYALSVKEATHGHGKMAELGGDVGVAAVAAVPQAVLAFLTRGQSLAESSLVSGIGPNAGLAGSLMSTIKSAMKNPSYLASMAQTLGPDFQEAKNAGASDLEAAATALIASSINAGVEIGGGLEKLGDADGTLVERILKRGHEEGWEEVLQGIISGTVNKGIYDFDKPVASLTDQNAILNPQRMATEYGTGAAVGMLLSGGTEVLASGARKATNKVLGTVDAKPIEKPAQLSPAADPAVQQVQAQAEITQAQNPESDVLDAATTMYFNLAENKGKNTLKKATNKADIVSRLIAGKKVEDGEINALNLTDAAYRNVFTQLTGVQFPNGSWSDSQVLRNLARSANKVAQQARQEQKVQAQQAQERARTIQEQMDEAGYKASPETQTRIDEETAKLASQVSNLDIGPDGKPLASLSTFAEAYRARVNPNATDEVIREQYAKFRDASRTILFGNHRLTKGQFTKLMRDNGKNLTDEQVNTLFNQAILDTLDGKDAFDRYTKKEDAGDKSSGGGISTKQKEAKTDGRTESRAETEDSREVEQGRSNRRGDQDGRRRDGAPETAVRDGAGQAEGKQAHLFSRGVQPLGRLSGLNNPRTRKTKIPDVKGTVQVVYRSDYTDEMKTAHTIARELGYSLNVTTGSFYSDFAGEYRRCTGLADRKNHIFTISARERGQTNFWSVFRHELFHLFAADRSFQTKFFMRLTETAKVPGLSSQDAVTQYLRRVTQKNEYLAPYREEFDTLGLTANDKSRCLWEEMCAELLANNNDGLQLDQQIFDALHKAAVEVFDEISPAYEARIKEQVRQDRLREKGYRLAEQQDTVDNERSDEVERPDRVFSLSKEQFWDEQLDNMENDADTQNALYIKETPNILAEIGLGDLPMCMTKSHAKDSMHAKDESNPRWHGIPESVMMRLPDLLSAPAMVLNSQTKRGDILVVLNAVDNDGLPVVAAIHPNGTATVDNVRGPANFILSVYGRSNFARKPGADSKYNLLYLALKDRNILYWNKKKTEHIAHLSGLQLPETMNKVPSDTILKQYRGYVKGRTPERMFSVDKYGDIEEKLDAIEQKNKALSDLVAKLEEAFPAEADYNFSTWLNAMHYLDNTSTTKLGFDPPMPFDDEIDVGYMHNGKWVSVATFENSKEGLKKFNQELAGLIQAEEEAEASEDIDELPDEWLLEDEEFDFDLLGISDDSTQYHGDDGETKYYHQQAMDKAQFSREGFTDTDSKAFKKWFHDDSGLLTGKDGRPKVFFRGSQNVGPTKFRQASEARSRGLFFSDRVDIATSYASGITASSDESVTAMDRLKGTRWNSPDREWKPYNFKSWNNARKYIEDNFMDKSGNSGIKLIGLDGETGEIVPVSRASIFTLSTNMATQKHRSTTPGMPLLSEDGWRELKVYHATKAGLTQINKDLGDFVRELGMGMRGYSKFYLSAENTFVFDAQNEDYGYLSDNRLPAKLQSGHDSGTQSINGLASRCFDNGYDCLIVKNVADDGGIQTQYVVKDPTQIKSVYNRGTWNRKEPDFMFSLAKEDYLMDYLDRVGVDYGGDFAQELFDAFESMDLSRRVAEAMSNIEASVGAAQLGFDPYSHLQNEYGTYEPGENPSRAVDLPLQTKDDNKVGRTPRNVMEAEATPDTRIESIEQAVVDHKFSYRVGHNKIMVRRAEAAIRKNGWAESLTNWTRDVRDGKVNSDLVAMGAVLLDNAGNSDMSGERYVQLVVDYHDLLHAAGQATQAGRILKNLTPGARLYGLRGYAKNMTERIRKGDPAHNIPVEKWMEVTGNLLADRLRTKLNVPKKHAKTVSQTILSDLNAFAKTAFPEQEKTPGRTEMDRINDLFDNYEKYKEAWDAAKETIKKEYADMPEALEVFNNFLETDLADTFIGQYFGHPEIRIDKALQDKFLAAKTDEERDAVTEEITKNIAQQIPATFMDKFTALRYLNMLGNFKTQIRNVTGNALNAGLTKGKNQVATLIELAVIKAGGKIERTKSFKKDPEVYRAALNDAEKMMDAILAGGKYEDGRRFDANIEKYRTIFKNKALEKYRKLTNEAMSRGDAVFSKIAYADALAGYLSAHGKTFETAGTELLDNARAYAMKQAAEATFRDSNMFSDAIVAMRFRNPDTVAKKALNMIGEGILPFRKTPANILVRAVEYSPVGVITTMAETVYGKKTGTFNANKLIDSLAKNATGTMIFAVGALLSNLGLLKGKEPDEDKEKEFDALTGHQAYSIELPNGMSLTLDWLAPSSVPLFLGAQFAENAADAGLSFRDVLTAMGAITDPMLQMSMLQGLDDALANASTYGDDSALVRFTGNALWSFLTQGLTNTMLGQLERSLTNERSTTYRDKHKDVPDGIQYLIGKTLEKVPLPGADYGQIPYIDAWGRIETNARTDFGNVLNQFFVPSYVSWVEESKMEKELRRLYEANPDENASVLISRPKSYFNVDSKRKDLTAEEFIEYATTRGQTAYNVATDLTESKIYRTLSDKQKAEAVLKAYDFANQMAKAVTTGYTPDKWGEEAPEGAVNPDKWVKDAMTCATEYGIPVGEYAAIYAATKDLESYKNAKGETVDNSKSLKVAVAIYDMGLSDVETKSLLEAFGVNQTVRKYSEKTARAKLKAMKDKYE